METYILLLWQTRTQLPIILKCFVWDVWLPCCLSDICKSKELSLSKILEYSCLIVFHCSVRQGSLTTVGGVALARALQCNKSLEKLKWVTVMSRKYAPPFCNLSLSTKHGGGGGGGLIRRDATFSLTITPSLPVPHNWVKHDLIVRGGW